MTPTPTVDQLFLVLEPFVVSIVGGEVVRAPVNRVSTPKGGFVVLSELLNIPLSTNVRDRLIVNETQGIKRPSEFHIQVDCYGPTSGDKATVISMLLRDVYACDYFAAKGYDVAPLYATDARQMPLVDGEAQYEARWTFEAVLQFNARVVIPQQSANTLSIENIFPNP